MPQSTDLTDHFSLLPSDYMDIERSCSLDQVYALRDLLRRQYINAVKQGEQFPQRAQRFLDTIEEVIASQERAAVLKRGTLDAAQQLRFRSN